MEYYVIAGNHITSSTKIAFLTEHDLSYKFDKFGSMSEARHFDTKNDAENYLLDLLLDEPELKLGVTNLKVVTCTTT